MDNPNSNSRCRGSFVLLRGILLFPVAAATPLLRPQLLVLHHERPVLLEGLPVIDEAYGQFTTENTIAAHQPNITRAKTYKAL